EHDLRIVGDPQRLAVDGLAVDDERNGVHAADDVRPPKLRAEAAEPAATAGRLQRRTPRALRTLPRLPSPAALRGLPPFAAAPSTSLLRWRRRHRLHAQIPARRLNARLVAVRERGPRQLAHFAACRVGNLQRHLPDLLLVQPRNDGRLRWIL